MHLAIIVITDELVHTARSRSAFVPVNRARRQNACTERAEGMHRNSVQCALSGRYIHLTQQSYNFHVSHISFISLYIHDVVVMASLTITSLSSLFSTFDKRSTSSCWILFFPIHLSACITVIVI